MHKTIIQTVAALIACSSVISGMPAAAQQHGNGGDALASPPRMNQNRDRSPRSNQDDHTNQNQRAEQRRPRYYGGHYGYQGYQGHWRAGQRFPHYRDRGYYISDYRAYGLPAPWRGYRYYRTDDGDIVMAAVASGLIGLIIGGALGH